ncbi:MAG: radical SAM/SPASM domain-containing protein [Desulfobacteraceae bacterium]
MIKRLAEIGRSLLERRPLDLQYLQVEVTTRCNLPGCQMCPRSAFRDRWQAHDLTWEDFERLLPSLACFEQVHLSGWGEPLVHPRLWEMARVARARGCKVGLTTNGQGLTEAVQCQALEHLDLLAISMDGARAATYEKLRPGADFDRLIRQIDSLCTRKRELGVSRPEVVLLFMKMRPNLGELPEFIELAASLGIDRVNATNLDFIPDKRMEPLALYNLAAVEPAIDEIIQQAEQKARELELPFRNFPLTPTLDLMVCDANPLKNAFVTVFGEFCPCVYLGLPVPQGFTRQFFGKTVAAHNYSYGNVRRGDFLKHCQQPAYRQFTDFFRHRVGRVQGLLTELVQHASVPTRQEMSSQPSAALEPHYSWPPACQGCYKILGF